MFFFFFCFLLLLFFFFFFSSRRRHTRFSRDWSSDVCSSDLSFVADCADPKGNRRKHRYEFREIDIVLLEGIFIFKPAYRRHFDLTAWVDCSFGTALKRAITRCQEGLSPAETIRAFSTIYFPAQRSHFARDNPQGAADFIIRNDNASRIHAKR